MRDVCRWYSVLGTLNSTHTRRKLRDMKPWLLPSAGVAVLLLTLAGCSYGPDKIRTAAKPAPMRTPEQIASDSGKVINQLELTIHSVRDAKTAKDAVPKVNEAFGRLMNLVQEGQTVARTFDPCAE